MTNDFVKQGYNKIAETYTAGRVQFENDSYLEKLNALLSPASIILDLGCGAGSPIDSYLINKGHTVIGIDISENMIELAKRNVPKAEYKVQDMTDLQEGEYRVDAVVSFYAIFHTPRGTHQELLRKIHSFLPQSGLILITMGSSEWEGTEDFYGTDMYWSHYNVKENRQLIEKVGFEILLDEIDGVANERHQIILAKKTS